MLDIISLLCLVIAVLLLTALIVIDIKVRLLPNVLVLGLAITGAVFHAAALFTYGNAIDLLIGATLGGGTLYLIRAIANKLYDADTLGLGDVKLMMAGGLWLGSYFITLALIVGAVAGILHGLILIVIVRAQTKEWPSLSRFSLPAGPGFAVGLFILALAKFAGLPHLSFL